MDNYAFRWKIDKYPVKAQVAGEHLKELEQENGGAISPALVLDDSRPSEAVLHPCFEWDDGKAAEKYRLGQSKELIGNLVTIRNYDNDKVRAQAPIEIRTFSNTARYGEPGIYTSTEIALCQERARENILENAKRELEQMRRKYEGILDFDSLLREILEKKSA